MRCVNGALEIDLLGSGEFGNRIGGVQHSGVGGGADSLAWVPNVRLSDVNSFDASDRVRKALHRELCLKSI